MENIIILLRCQYCPKRSTDSMEFSQWKILEETEKSIKKFIRNLKGLWIAKKKKKRKEKKWQTNTSWFQNLPQSCSNQNTGIRTDIYTKETKQGKTHIYRGKAIFSINGVGKTGNPHAKEWS